MLGFKNLQEKFENFVLVLFSATTIWHFLFNGERLVDRRSLLFTLRVSAFIFFQFQKKWKYFTKLLQKRFLFFLIRRNHVPDKQESSNCLSPFVYHSIIFRFNFGRIGFRGGIFSLQHSLHVHCIRGGNGRFSLDFSSS